MYYLAKASLQEHQRFTGPPVGSVSDEVSVVCQCRLAVSWRGCCSNVFCTGSILAKRGKALNFMSPTDV
jgi:hypothetical protein